MMKLNKTLWAILSFSFAGQALASDYNIKHLEPLSWWTGMKESQLQLMIHGDHIGDLTPSLQYPGVKITKVTHVENKNYLFVDVDISKSAQPGEMKLQFSEKNKVVLTQNYQLNARAKGSVERKGFSPSDVIYLIVPDRFANGNESNDSVSSLKEKVNRSFPGGRHGGDIQGIVDHLDYIAGMGYTQIWPTPLTQNDAAQYSYHGYANTDLYQIDARFGSNEEYRAMVSKAKEKGLGVIQDIVLNHIGSEHWWMKDMPTHDWLNFPDKFVATNHKRTTLQDPHAAKVDREVFSNGWFVESMPDLNQSNPLVANYLIQNNLWWIEYAGLSGIRTDTYSYSDKTFLARWSKRLTTEYPNINLVGEEWSTNPAIVSYWQRGKINHDHYVSSMPSMMDFPIQEALHEALTKPENWDTGLTRLYETISNDFLYPNPGNLVIFEGNHDTPRIFSELNEDLGLYKMAIAYLATMRGIPQFTYGTEVLLTSPKQRDDGKVRSDFPGGWKGDTVNGFTGEGLTAQQKDAQDFTRKLLNWRKTTSAVHNGKLLHFTPENGTYVYFRYDDKNKVLVAFNKNDKEATLATDRFAEILPANSSGKDIFSGQTISLAKSLVIPARSVLILEVK